MCSSIVRCGVIAGVIMLGSEGMPASHALAAPSSRPQMELADYERAALFQNARTLVSRTRLKPNWIAQSDRFWYLDEVGQGEIKNKAFVLVDPERDQQGPAFDHVRLAAGLSAAAGKEYAATKLPFSSFTYAESNAAIRFRVEQADWSCNLQTYACSADVTTAGARDGEVLSPDGHWAVSVLDHDLWVRDTRTGEERALTRDGQEDRIYGVTETMSPVTRRLLRASPWPVPEVEFSPDSRYLSTYRADVSEVRKLAVIQTMQGARPVTHDYHYPVAGDAEVPQVEVYLSELRTGALRKVGVPAFGLAASYGLTNYWSEDSAYACFIAGERGFKSVGLHLVDAATGRVHTPVVERSDTYINRGVQARIVGDDLVWSSERDGWNHLYRLDATSGEVRLQLTRGEWAVREIVHVDEQSRRIYFVAGGREAGQDPYYRHLYRVNLDGAELQHLTPEPADHTIVFSPTGRYFIDTYSRLDQPSVSLLRRADGQVVRELQRADIGPLRAAGWKPARLFTVKARDGHTPLYGAMFLPSNFDPERRYPVLDSVYPGPQVIKTPKSFEVDKFENEMALAELGFIVVTIDGLGTPLRSKAFRDVSYRNMGAAGGLEDHISGLRQLAQRHPYLDLDRVGIYGHSGGGYASARALLKFPEFYKVAVSSSGNHDQLSYWAEWGERFHAWPVTEEAYLDQANPPLAGNLRGKLLLVHGDMDDNVHHANTMQMVDALVAANKDFDLLILPNRDHALVNVAQGRDALRRPDPYFLRRRWDYFVEHLQGAVPPPEFELRLQP